ncbi:MAG: hypothetical protein U5L72_18890 [Bacteroidales bacterium]|nr:hypothetical protein [Bacteroidales bacterium]
MRQGLRTSWVSNGLHEQEQPLKQLCRYLDGANIDLKSLVDSTYLKLTGGKLQPVLEALKIYRDEGVWLEITNLVVPGWTDKPDEIRQMCKWLAGDGFTETPAALQPVPASIQTGTPASDPCRHTEQGCGDSPRRGTKICHLWEHARSRD